MNRYVIEKTVYGKFAVNVVDSGGRTVQTVSLHETRNEAFARAKLLDTTNAGLRPIKAPKPNSDVPPALRGGS